MGKKEITALKEKFKEDIEKSEFQGHVLETLIYFASSFGKERIPTIEEFIRSEVIAATIEYLTGKEYLFIYNRSEDGKELLTVASGWEWKTDKAMAEALEKYGAKLNQPLREALGKLTEITTSHDDWGDPGHHSWLYTWYKHQICQSWMVSTFSLSVEFIANTEKRVIPSLDKETLRHCKAIARIMKKYIKSDIKFIGKRYRW
jgi:hypothetical protein